jgi:outer membrane protein assembly factor BamB
MHLIWGFRLTVFGALFLVGSAVCADEWPQWLGPKRDAVWRESGVVEKFPTGGPPILWRTKIGGGYAGPIVASGCVYVADRTLAQGATNPSNPFDRSVVRGLERVLCQRESDGRIFWKHEYDCPYTLSHPTGPRVAPMVNQGKVYTLGAEGTLLCLDAISGKVLWSHEFKKDFGINAPVWGFAGHPLLEGNRLICLAGGAGSTAVAFHQDTGKELWRALSATEPGYSSPIIYQAGGKRQLILGRARPVGQCLHREERRPVLPVQ